MGAREDAHVTDHQGIKTDFTVKASVRAEK